MRVITKRIQIIQRLIDPRQTCCQSGTRPWLSLRLAVAIGAVKHAVMSLLQQRRQTIAISRGVLHLDRFFDPRQPAVKFFQQTRHNRAPARCQLI